MKAQEHEHLKNIRLMASTPHKGPQYVSYMLLGVMHGCKDEHSLTLVGTIIHSEGVTFFINHVKGERYRMR